MARWHATCGTTFALSIPQEPMIVFCESYLVMIRPGSLTYVLVSLHV